LLWWGYANGSGLGVGAHYSNVHNQTTDDNSGMLGAQLRLRGSIIGVEGAIDYRNDKLGGGTELRSWPISASLLIYPLPPVYAMAGLGWYNTTIDFSSSSPYKNETQSKLGYHFGAGLELPVAPALKLVGDIRWQFVDYEFKNIPSSIGKVNADSYSINAGFLFYLR
jgi:opacity protein-like surface antigen